MRHVKITKWWGTRGILLLIIFVLCGFAFYAGHKLNSPVHGVKTASSEKVTTRTNSSTNKTEVTNGNTKLENNYFRLDITGSYSVTSQANDNNSPQYTATLLKRSTAGTQVVSITIENNSGGLESNSSYRLRSEHSDTYKSGEVSVGKTKLQTFTDTRDGSIAAFWLHGSYIATVSVSSSGFADTNDLAATLKEVLDGWQWL